MLEILATYLTLPTVFFIGAETLHRYLNRSV